MDVQKCRTATSPLHLGQCGSLVRTEGHIPLSQTPMVTDMPLDGRRQALIRSNLSVSAPA